MIGIVGGIGSYAGLDLVKKIFDLTNANSDQEHLPVNLISNPSIPDRTLFLENKCLENPAYSIFEVIKKLYFIGSTIIGIPCNTAHSIEIFEVIKKLIISNNLNINLLNMIDEVNNYIEKEFSSVKKVGILSTTGTYKSKVYDKTFNSDKFDLIYPDFNIQENFVHDSIYNPDYGIKSVYPVSKKAKDNLIFAIEHLHFKKVEIIILACTELPLAIQDKKYKNISFVDSTFVLANSLIKEFYSQKRNNYL